MKLRYFCVKCMLNGAAVPSSGAQRDVNIQPICWGVCVGVCERNDTKTNQRAKRSQTSLRNNVLGSTCWTRLGITFQKGQALRFSEGSTSIRFNSSSFNKAVAQ